MVFETHFVSVALLFLTAASLATATTLYDLTFEHCNDTRSRAYQTHRGFEFEGLDVLNLFHSGQLHRVPLKLLWSAVEVTSNDKVVENSQLASLRALVLSSLFSNYAESNPPVLLSPFANASLGCSSKVCEISCSVVPDNQRIAFLVVGLALFLLGGVVARSSVFHYSVGPPIMILVLLTVMMQRPKTVAAPGALAMLAVKFSGMDLGQHMSVYLAIGLFVLCAVGVYLFDLPSHPRLCNVIELLIKAGGLLLVSQGVSSNLLGFGLAGTVFLLGTSLSRVWPANGGKAVKGGGEEEEEEEEEGEEKEEEDEKGTPSPARPIAPRSLTKRQAYMVRVLSRLDPKVIEELYNATRDIPGDPDHPKAE